jgi:hypothetical protein
MSPTDIVREAKRMDGVLFAKLTTQVVGRMIDRKPGVKPCWSEATLARAADGYNPGGQNTRQGILVRWVILYRQYH